MKIKISNYVILVILFLSNLSQIASAQEKWVRVTSNSYDEPIYQGYDPDGDTRGIYTFTLSKSLHTFTPGQFTVNVSLPYGAVYAGGGVIPEEFIVTNGLEGSPALVISIRKNWANTVDEYRFDIPIKIIAPAQQQPTSVSVQWLDAFSTSKNEGNSTLLNVNGGKLSSRFSKQWFGEKNVELITFPNPVKYLLKIKGAAAGKIQLINNAGKVVFSSDNIPTEGIDMVSLSAGVYLVRVTHKDGSSIIRKVVKQ